MLITSVPGKSKRLYFFFFFLGNFAVVRLCKETLTSKEYALKIIDKSKCKGKVSLYLLFLKNC